MPPLGYWSVSALAWQNALDQDLHTKRLLYRGEAVRFAIHQKNKVIQLRLQTCCARIRRVWGRGFKSTAGWHGVDDKFWNPSARFGALYRDLLAKTIYLILNYLCDLVLNLMKLEVTNHFVSFFRCELDSKGYLLSHLLLFFLKLNKRLIILNLVIRNL